jgi:hypothetical protein
MRDFYQRTPAPCIVNEGVLINRTDIIRALETLENVKYSFIVDNEEISSGDGVVVKVFASPDSSTLVVNDCLFLNVLSFNYLRFHKDENDSTAMDLVEDAKTLRLTSIDGREQRNRLSNRDLFAGDFFDEETHAELFEDSDDDDRF